MINSEEPSEVFDPLSSRRPRRVTGQSGSLGNQPGYLDSGERSGGCQPSAAGRPASYARWQKRDLAHAAQVPQKVAGLLVRQLTGSYAEGTHEADRPLHRLLDQ